MGIYSEDAGFGFGEEDEEDDEEGEEDSEEDNDQSTEKSIADSDDEAAKPIIGNKRKILSAPKGTPSIYFIIFIHL